MLKTGLCSVTFREYSVEQVITLAARAGIKGIEWGADKHVLPGNYSLAEKTANLTRKAGLEVVSYGSYFKAGCENAYSFEEILKTARTLNAPAIRIWAGNRGSNECDRSCRENVVSDCQKVASIAEKDEILINLEYHAGTLTDSSESAYHLMEEINHKNVGIYWQPPVGQSVDSNIKGIKKVLPWLTHIHVFQWTEETRLPLMQGKQEWHQYLEQIGHQKGKHYTMLEFVKGDNREQFKDDAKVLSDLVMQTANE